jgi:hypothetical protein
MDPLTIHLALGCILSFSHVDHAMTEEEGRTPDGVVYKTVALTDAQGRHRVLEHGAPGQGFSPGALFRAGRSPDGLFASYAVFEYAAGHNTGDVRFVSAKTCTPVRFVLVRNGATVGAASYQGWLKDPPHGVRVLQNAREYELALPIDEARLANPGIQE